jgi:hypothetical protein
MVRTPSLKGTSALSAMVEDCSSITCGSPSPRHPPLSTKPAALSAALTCWMVSKSFRRLMLTVKWLAR